MKKRLEIAKATEILKKDSVEYVYEQIRQMLFNCLVLARADVVRLWGKMSYNQRREAIKALLVMENVAKQPEIYFSREKTWAAWKQRADEYTKQKNIKDTGFAYYIVQDPKGIVCHAAAGAMTAKMNQTYYNACDLVQKWEYARTNPTESRAYEAMQYAKGIEKKNKELAAMANVVQSNCFVRPFRQLAYSIQH